MGQVPNHPAEHRTQPSIALQDVLDTKEQNDTIDVLGNPQALIGLIPIRLLLFRSLIPNYPLAYLIQKTIDKTHYSMPAFRFSSEFQ